ncbi:type II toxin-antitoxin system HicA family toxin [bacterium]|nr:type II toxin-antitoxin system HicA family toxin [bacterium]
MAKFRVLSGKEVCAILARHGFRESRRRGSHIIMKTQSAAGKITVAVPDHREIRIGTLKSIIRQSGLPSAEFSE